MKVQFLGVGSAFANETFQSNMLLEEEGRLLLFDAGGDLRRSLKAAGRTLRDIDAVFISHLHTDHAGALEYIALSTYFDPGFVDEHGKKRRPKLFLHKSMRSRVWQMLRHGCVFADRKSTLDDYFEVITLDTSFIWQGIEFSLVPSVHSVDNGRPIPCFGLSCVVNGTNIWISGDTVLDHGFSRRYDHGRLFAEADVIFHDCETGFPTPVHAHYDELIGLAPDVRAKTWLYHFNDGERKNCVADGFRGWVEQGQTFEF